MMNSIILIFSVLIIYTAQSEIKIIDTGETNDNGVIKVDGTIELKNNGHNLDNENIKEIELAIDIPKLDFRVDPWDFNGEGIVYGDDRSIHFTISSNLGSKFDCEFQLSYWYKPSHGHVGKFFYKLTIDGFNIENIVYNMEISDDKGEISHQNVKLLGHRKAKESVLKQYERNVGDPEIPIAIKGSIKAEFIPNYEHKDQIMSKEDLEENKKKELEADYEYEDYDDVDEDDIWTQGLEIIKEMENMQGISVEEYKENRVRIKEVFNQMLKLSEKNSENFGRSKSSLFGGPQLTFEEWAQQTQEEDEKIERKIQKIESGLYDDYNDIGEDLNFDLEAIEEKVSQYRKNNYNSENIPNQKDKLDPSEIILLEKAVQEMDNELLISVVNDNQNKNPLVDSQTKDTVLHFLARQELDDANQFFTVARNIHGLFIKNANGETPINIAAIKGHVNIIRYICLESQAGMKKNSEFSVKTMKRIIGTKFLKKALFLAGQNGHKPAWLFLYAHLLDLNDKKAQQIIHKYVTENKPKFHEDIQKTLQHINEDTTAQEIYKLFMYNFDLYNGINQGVLDHWEKFLLERSLSEKDTSLLRNLLRFRNTNHKNDDFTKFHGLLQTTTKNPLVDVETKDTVLHYILKWKHGEIEKDDLKDLWTEDELHFLLSKKFGGTIPKYYLSNIERKAMFSAFMKFQYFIDEVFMPNNNQDSPFDLAVTYGYVEIVDEIMKLALKEFFRPKENGKPPNFHKFMSGTYKKGFIIAGEIGHVEIWLNLYISYFQHDNPQKDIKDLHDFLMENKSKFHEEIINLMKAMKIFEEVANRKKHEHIKQELMAEFKPGELEKLRRTFKKPEMLDSFMKNNTKPVNMRSKKMKTEL